MNDKYKKTKNKFFISVGNHEIVKTLNNLYDDGVIAINAIKNVLKYPGSILYSKTDDDGKITLLLRYRNTPDDFNYILFKNDSILVLGKKAFYNTVNNWKNNYSNNKKGAVTYKSIW